MKKVLFISLLAFAGCISITQHAVCGSKVVNTYAATSDVYVDCIRFWNQNDFQRKHPIFTMYTQILYPFWFVDFCGEIVIDTLTYPYDLHNKLEYEDNLRKYKETHYFYNY